MSFSSALAISMITSSASVIFCGIHAMSFLGMKAP